MLRRLAVRPQVMLRQVQECSPDHDSSQVEEMANGFGLHFRQGPVQPQHGVLEHVVGLLPAPQVLAGMEHLPRQPQEPVASVVEEGVPGCFVAGQNLVNQQLQLRVRIFGHRHPWSGGRCWSSAHSTRGCRGRLPGTASAPRLPTLPCEGQAENGPLLCRAVRGGVAPELSCRRPLAFADSGD